jgi:hypothetical protein
VRLPPPRLISIISAGFTGIGSTTAIRPCSRGEQIAMASMASGKSTYQSRGWNAALKVAVIWLLLGFTKKTA